MLNMFAQHAYILKLIPVWDDVLEWPVPFRLLVPRYIAKYWKCVVIRFNMVYIKFLHERT